MKTQFSDPNYAKRVALLTAQAMHVYPPFIPFKKNKKKDKKELDFKYIDVPLDAANPEDTTEWNIPMFETGEPEDWIKWKIYFDKLAARYRLDTSDKQNNMLLTLLQGEAYDVYTTEFADGIDKTRTEEQKKNLVKKALNAVTMNIFDDDSTAWRRQKSYMRYNLYFKQGELKVFKLQLYELNKYLKYFPVPSGKTKVDSLDENELLEIIDRAKPIHYQQDCLKSNIDPFTKTPNEYLLGILRKLETSARIDEAINKEDKPKGKGKGKRKCDDADSSKKHCTKCNKNGHESKDCWYDKTNKSKRPKWFKDRNINGNKEKSKSEHSNTITFTKEQFNYLCTTLPTLNNKQRKKKRKVKDDSSTEEDAANYMSKLKLSGRNNHNWTEREIHSAFDLLSFKFIELSTQVPVVSCQVIDMAGQFTDLSLEFPQAAVKHITVAYYWIGWW